jgi:hypothetical protein
MPENNQKPTFRTIWQRIADRAERGMNVTLTPASALQVATALAAVGREAKEADFTFAVEQWSDDDSRIEETLAQCRNVAMARAAFQAAVEQRPKSRIYLRQRTQVLEKYEPHFP